MLPGLNLEGFSDTKHAIHQYCKVLGNIRASLTKTQKHYWHISLLTWSQGFTTTPVEAVPGRVFELFLNLLTHKIEIATNTKNFSDIKIEGQSQSELTTQILNYLNKIDIDIDLNIGDLNQNSLEYSRHNAENFFKSYSVVDIILKNFRSDFKEECSPVQLWPHHLDIAFSWFSGNKINGEDPEDEGASDEQVGYGFIAGDEVIDEPYFYVLPYPAPELNTDTHLLHNGSWQTEGWTGAVLRYNDIFNHMNADKMITEFLMDTHKKLLNINCT